MPFEQRAAVLEEQVAVLRALWTERSVTIDGRFHHIRASGLAPPPVQRPIPIWIGGHAPAALRRVGRIADGWFPQVRPGGGLESALELIREGAAEAGRDVSNLEFEGRLEYSTRDHDKIAEHARRWRGRGSDATCRSTPCMRTSPTPTRTSARSRRWRRSCCRPDPPPRSRAPPPRRRARGVAGRGGMRRRRGLPGALVGGACFIRPGLSVCSRRDAGTERPPGFGRMGE